MAGTKGYISTMDNDQPSDTDVIKQLENKIGYSNDLASAFVRARGRCEYCGADLLMSRQGYAIAEIDHLLPRSKFAELSDNKQNHVLSCSTCNGVKKDESPLNKDKGEVANQMLEENRCELILRARKYIADKMEDYDEDWRKATRILHRVWWEKVPNDT